MFIAVAHKRRTQWPNAFRVSGTVWRPITTHCACSLCHLREESFDRGGGRFIKGAFDRGGKKQGASDRGRWQLTGGHLTVNRSEHVSWRVPRYASSATLVRPPSRTACCKSYTVQFHVFIQCTTHIILDDDFKCHHCYHLDVTYVWCVPCGDRPIAPPPGQTPPDEMPYAVKSPLSQMPPGV